MGREDSTASELTPEVEEQLMLLLELLGEGKPKKSVAAPKPVRAQKAPAQDPITRPEELEEIVVDFFEIVASNLPLLPADSLPHPERDRATTAGAENSESAPDKQHSPQNILLSEASKPVSKESQATDPERDRAEQPQAPDPTRETALTVRSVNPSALSAATDDPVEDPEYALFAQLQSLLVGSEMAQAEEKVVQLNRQLAQLERLISDPAELIDLLLPVVAELLDRKVKMSQEEMCAALFPLIDKMIYQRAKQDREAVSSALAEVIPVAITKELEKSPQTLVNAIAPAMGAAIKEQIRLDRNSVIQALAPEMGRAIKQQIEIERDAMVDALYPVIGSTIRRYLAEAIQDINRKVSNALSIEGIKRKISAKVQGVSEAELIFRESMPAKVQAVFLIHKASGLVICQAHQSDILHLDADMIGGMLTAIRSFVNDCIAQSGSESELNEIEYGDSKILIEVAGYCYLAVVIQNDPPSYFIEKIRNTLSYIVQKYGEPIEQFDGDPETIPEAVLPLVENLLEVETQSSLRKGFPWALAGMSAAAAVAIAIPLGFYQYQHSVNRRLEREALAALYSAPELSVYRFNATATRKTLTLEGRVPSEALRDKVEEIVRPLASNRQLDNQILAVNVPPDPARVEAEVKRVETLLNQESGVKISARYQTLPSSGALPTRGKVAIAGTVNSVASAQKIVRAFERIPGVNSINTAIGLPSVEINTRIYFKKGLAQIEPVDLQAKINAVVRHLKQYPEIHLKIVGYSPTSEEGDSSQLALQRAIAVRTALLERGVAPVRLEVQGLAGLPSDVRENAPNWMSQCVRFEAISSLDRGAIAPTLAR